MANSQSLHNPGASGGGACLALSVIGQHCVPTPMAPVVLHYQFLQAAKGHTHLLCVVPQDFLIVLLLLGLSGLHENRCASPQHA